MKNYPETLFVTQDPYNDCVIATSLHYKDQVLFSVPGFSNIDRMEHLLEAFGYIRNSAEDTRLSWIYEKKNCGPVDKPAEWLLNYPARVQVPERDSQGTIIHYWTQLHVNLYDVPTIKMLWETDLETFISDIPDAITEYMEDGEWKELVY